MVWQYGREMGGGQVAGCEGERFRWGRWGTGGRRDSEKRETADHPGRPSRNQRDPRKSRKDTEGLSTKRHTKRHENETLVWIRETRGTREIMSEGTRTASKEEKKNRGSPGPAEPRPNAPTPQRRTPNVQWGKRRAWRLSGGGRTAIFEGLFEGLFGRLFEGC
jgi:hypothetical protein